MSESDFLKTLLSGATIVGALGYIIHSVWTGYTDFKRDIYGKIAEKVDKYDCKEFRDDEERRLKEHREEGHGRK